MTNRHPRLRSIGMRRMLCTTGDGEVKLCRKSRQEYRSRMRAERSSSTIASWWLISSS